MSSSGSTFGGGGVSGDPCLKEGLEIQLRVLRATWLILFYMNKQSKSNTTLVAIRYRSNCRTFSQPLFIPNIAAVMASALAK